MIPLNTRIYPNSNSNSNPNPNPNHNHNLQYKDLRSSFQEFDSTFQESSHGLQYRRRILSLLGAYPSRRWFLGEGKPDLETVGDS